MLLTEVEKEVLVSFLVITVDILLRVKLIVFVDKTELILCIFVLKVAVFEIESSVTAFVNVFDDSKWLAEETEYLVIEMVAETKDDPGDDIVSLDRSCDFSIGFFNTNDVKEKENEWCNEGDGDRRMEEDETVVIRDDK